MSLVCRFLLFVELIRSVGTRVVVILCFTLLTLCLICDDCCY